MWRARSRKVEYASEEAYLLLVEEFVEELPGARLLGIAEQRFRRAQIGRAHV